MEYHDNDADEEWVDDDGDPDDEELMCPSCGASVHEDTQQCPHCGDWITPVWPRSHGKQWLWILAAVLAIAGLLAITLR
jgi:predicted nucleic acid-binding Zn ribbon protein